MRIVPIPSDAIRLPRYAQGVHQRFGGCGHPLRLPLLEGARRHLLRRGFEIERRQWIHHQERRIAGLDPFDETVHAILLQGVGQDGDQNVQIVRIVSLGRYLHDVVLLLKLLHDRPGARLLARLEVEASEQVDACSQDAHPLALGVRDDPHGAHDFVFDGQSNIEERNDEFLAACTEDQSHEDLVRRPLRLEDGRDRPRADRESVARLARLFGELHRVDDVGVNSVPAASIEFAQHRDNVVASLHVAARHLGTEVSLNENRPRIVEAADQLARVGGKRVQSFRSGVDASADTPDQNRGAAQSDQQGNRPHRVMTPEGRRPLAGCPVASAEHRDVEVKHRRGEADEVQHARKRDHAVREVAELLHEGEAFQEPPQASAQDVSGMLDEHGHRAKQCPEDVRDRQVAGELRRQHA